jgi:CHC2 zinc finger/Toprim domain
VVTASAPAGSPLRAAGPVPSFFGDRVMPILLRDYETRSQLLLKAVGAWKYSAHASTDVWCCAYEVDDGPIELWIPGNPVPSAFVEAATNPDWLAVAFNDQFERLIEKHIMAPRYGWPEIPIERHRCLQASALALALPASLSGVADALQLEQRKDPAGRRNMLAMSRPRRPRAGEDPAGIYWLDDAERPAQLYAYAAQDVRTERALYHRIGFLPPEEHAHWLLDARINDRGIHLDRKLLDAASQIAEAAQREIDDAVATLTEGAVSTVNQTAKLLAWLNVAGCAVTDLQKNTLVKALTQVDLSALARRALELRLDGAHAAAKKLHTMRSWLSDDDRVRGCFRFHGASPGRFTSLGIQMQNMKRPGVKDMAAAIEAVATGDLNHLRSRYPQPMSVVGDIARALVCAPPSRKLIIADFSGIESRMTAWVSGQQSKLDQWANYDRTGDPEDEPYFITGRMFGLQGDQARTCGKVGDLAFGYMGGAGAWAKLAPAGDTSTEIEINGRQKRWRRAHPQTMQYWHALNRAAKSAMRHPGKIVPCRGVAFRYCSDSFLRMRLPNGRKLAYPFPKLKTTKRGDTAVVFFDNQKGKWAENRHGQGAYGGTWTENLVQAVARDLFIEAMQRLEAAGYGIVLHAHDEAVAEVPLDFGSIEEFTRIFTELPSWASGLPVAAKARVGDRWCKFKPEATSEPEPLDEPTPEGLTDDDDEGDATPMPDAAPDTLLRNSLEGDVPRPRQREAPGRASLIDLIGEPLVDGKICCPFHEDSTPSLHVYADHFHCFGCGAHGDAVDWLMTVEGLDRDAAPLMLEHGPPDTPHSSRSIETRADNEAKRRRALQLWRQSKPIAGTLAERYLAEHRGIGLAALPDAAASLRFHPHCPFGPATRHPCLIALRRDVVSDEPVSIHRIALTPDGQKIERRMLGSGGVVKLYPASDRLVIGEGIETTLAAATRITRWGELLQPAWSAVASGVLANLPPIPGVERLIILVDNDINGAGQAAARRCAETWSRAGRSVVRLTPKRQGTDFNDLVRELAS